MLQKWSRRLLRVILVLTGLFILLCFVFDYYIQFRKSDEELKSFFDEHGIPGRISYKESAGRRIRYVTIGSDSLPTIFMIHGSPSSLSIYERYFTDSLFLRQFKMVAVDRPGYGGSGFGIPEPSIEKQAAMLLPILRDTKNAGKPVMIVGGSYGTSVACRMMMDDPGAADGLLLVAPSLAPGEEKVFWFAPLIETPLIRWFIPRMFQSANTEKLNHRAELEKMVPLWPRIRVPVLYLQGSKDELIYTTNADFARKKLVNAPYLNIEFLKDRPHFFAFSDSKIIRQKMLDLYSCILKSDKGSMRRQ